MAEEIILKSKDMPLYGDLEVHANLAEGDLPAKKFDLSGTTIRLDDIVGEALTAKQEKKREAWFCEVELQKGNVTFGKPMEADGQILLKMYDTRPIVAMLKDLGTAPKGLSMMPNIKDVGGTMGVGYGKGRMEVDDLALTGEKFEALGWLHILDKKANGRLFIKYGIVAAGVALDPGKGKLHLTKPRKWFEKQPSAPSKSAEPAPADNS